MKKIFYIAVSFSFLSCSIIINNGLKYMGVFEKSVDFQEITKENQKIIFIPMKHMGTKEFYFDVKTKIDSLKKEGYYFFLEAPGTGQLNNRNDTLRLDTLARKYRKISGKSLSFIASGRRNI